MRVYELVMVLQSSLSEAQRKKLIDTVKTWLGDVKIAKEDEWGQKPLAYPIKKEIAGFYLLFNLETNNSIPLDLEKKLLTNENILRHLLIRKK
ncbi:MAG: 30S ribosomal protein S6 [Candidatus Levybacteria bacterium]|nr:30S ribosomal protein S6 [Candidatus Levybacteria bacterium]MBI3069921.1 30S ribosomal protein S6 [Candidatus Levybacteria bacterium]MBI3093099.1 30S ribosomal protein S6 [Candidatus Levybacteria bacterium]